MRTVTGAFRLLKLPASLQETLLHLLLAAVISVSVMTFPLNFIEAPLFDLRQNLSAKPTIDERIAIVTIDDQTLNQLSEVAPLPLRFHQKAVQEFERHEVKAVGYLVDFNKVQRLDDPNFTSDSVQEFYRSTVRLNAQGIPFMLGIPYDMGGEVGAPYPLSQIPQSVAIIHKDGSTFGRDKVTRRALVSLYDKMAFEMALANRIYSNENILNPPGTYKSAEADAQYFLFRLHQNEGRIYDPEYENFAYPRYSFSDLVEGKIPDGTLKDKIILVGSFQRENPSDFTLLNSLHDPIPVPKVLIQANILDSILNQQGLQEVSATPLAILCFILSLVVVIASFRIRPSRLIGLTVVLLAGIALISLILFQPIPLMGSHWLPLGAPFLSLTLSFYLMIPLRLYSEHRKRFALEKENKILLEVEELKTNFIQLVTHDLKTPVARIQGLTEQLRRSLGENVRLEDRELIEHLLGANHELNNFIGSLLELTKLDSQGLRVSLQSRDINPLLESVISKLRFNAHSKRINISTDFEPLFPIRIDSELISKVLSNLIDNAIKYSPENTTVFITTRETGDRVTISIRDEGVGISETEIPNLFSRFHRVKNDNNYKVKGTGLGLYLSKYFIEAHQGTISVQSSPGQGTTFTLTLPVNLRDSEVIQPGLRFELSENGTAKKKENAHA
ncbi:MAG: CHASE2 domain-containing protein [Bdellovibrionales bacterium]|nr:CHASE2 domain-containing protein [Bdellovibrionales bacterium]